ncbi:unnamed protein product [Acanthoscelides obtectus]|uniref:DDE Tnp4 domain-containing protein n=1 Tax=Acanthoscelides obtectus TaxID=200917 RepID=A0A9P0NQM2_ACAOB|nr:unnamed protein product [Acanthoscelides obtectus]CAK1657899.1 Protein ALP1-like [Acanthoscelides obtectus]
MEKMQIYSKTWNFPNCVGAIDGKHVVIMALINSGSEYINYKGTFSIVLMALCDADYNVIYSNIGSQGRISDGGVFNNCSLYEALENKTLNLPSDKPLPMRAKPVPYVIVGDNAFPLKDYLMVPDGGNHDNNTPERIFNYRLSRARRIIENVFGIMSAVFRVLRKPILLNQDKARLITECCVLLHNFLRSRNSRNMYTPPGTFDREENGTIVTGSWRNETTTNITSVTTKKGQKNMLRREENSRRIF